MTKDSKWNQSKHFGGSSKRDKSDNIVKFPTKDNKNDSERDTFGEEELKKIEGSVEDFLNDLAIFQTTMIAEFASQLSDNISEDICGDFISRNSESLKSAFENRNRNLEFIIESYHGKIEDSFSDFIESIGGEDAIEPINKSYIKKLEGPEEFSSVIFSLVNEVLAQEFKELDEACNFLIEQARKRGFNFIVGGIATGIVHEIYHGHIRDMLDDGIELPCGCTVGEDDFLKYNYSFCPICGNKIKQ